MDLAPLRPEPGGWAAAPSPLTPRRAPCSVAPRSQTAPPPRAPLLTYLGLSTWVLAGPGGSGDSESGSSPDLCPRGRPPGSSPRLPPSLSSHPHTFLLLTNWRRPLSLQAWGSPGAADGLREQPPSCRGPSGGAWPLPPGLASPGVLCPLPGRPGRPLAWAPACRPDRDLMPGRADGSLRRCRGRAASLSRVTADGARKDKQSGLTRPPLLSVCRRCQP